MIFLVDLGLQAFRVLVLQWGVGIRPAALIGLPDVHLNYLLKLPKHLQGMSL